MTLCDDMVTATGVLRPARGLDIPELAIVKYDLLYLDSYCRFSVLVR
jgi:hypothetical protein